MATLFNQDIQEINYASLVSALSISPLSDTTVEDLIITTIEDSFLIQENILKLAYAYHEDMIKHSTRDIATSRDKIHLANSIPTIIAESVLINTESNATLVTGLMKRNFLKTSYYEYYWSFSESVFLRNENYSINGLLGSVDILASTEMKDYYFLTNKAEQSLYRCGTSIIGTSQLFESIRSDRVLSKKDIETVYFLKDETLNILNKNLNIGFFSVTSNLISGDSAYIQDGEVTRIMCDSGTVTLMDTISKYMPLERPYVDDSAIIEEAIQTNSKIMIDASIELKENKAPFSDWEPSSLRKSNEKSTVFKEELVSLLLAGTSIEDNDLLEYKSIVSKKELGSILSMLGEEIINMDVCDDN